MSRRLSIFGVALILMLAVVLAGSGLRAQEIQIKTEESIPVVYNPKEPVPQPDCPSSLSLQKDLVLGGENEDQDYPFSLLSYLVIDDDENMIVLDNEESCIKIFDSEGKCFTRLTLPEEEMVFAIKKNKVYTVNRSDFPSLTRYAMTWR